MEPLLRLDSMLYQINLIPLGRCGQKAEKRLTAPNTKKNEINPVNLVLSEYQHLFKYKNFNHFHKHNNRHTIGNEERGCVP